MARASRRMLLGALALAGTLPAAAADDPRQVLRLYPGKSPGEQGEVPAEMFVQPPAGQKSDIQRLTNVSEPSLTVFPAPKSRATGAGLIIAPGGGYHILAWDLEGEEVARRFNEAGVTAFLLKYRVPRRSHDPGNKLPLMDAQRAVSLVRHRAREWGVDPGKVGLLGFSAGGHLTAHACSQADMRAYEAFDEADRASARPDYAVLIYPGGLLDRQDPSKLAPELKVNAATPPTLIAVAADDKSCAEASMGYFAALQKAAVKSELHIYTSGGHGFGLRPRGGNAASWPDRCVEWMRGTGILPSKG